MNTVSVNQNTNLMHPRLSSLSRPNQPPGIASKQLGTTAGQSERRHCLQGVNVINSHLEGYVLLLFAYNIIVTSVNVSMMTVLQFTP